MIKVIIIHFGNSYKRNYSFKDLGAKKKREEWDREYVYKVVYIVTTICIHDAISFTGFVFIHQNAFFTFFVDMQFAPTMKVVHCVKETVHNFESLFPILY